MLFIESGILLPTAGAPTPPSGIELPEPTPLSIPHPKVRAAPSASPIPPPRRATSPLPIPPPDGVPPEAARSLGRGRSFHIAGSLHPISFRPRSGYPAPPAERSIATRQSVRAAPHSRPARTISPPAPPRAIPIKSPNAAADRVPSGARSRHPEKRRKTSGRRDAARCPRPSVGACRIFRFRPAGPFLLRRSAAHSQTSPRRPAIGKTAGKTRPASISPALRPAPSARTRRARGNLGAILAR